jgi:ribonuclease VapC
MVLDTSAIVTILLDEPERAAFDRRIEHDPTRLVSAASRIEATFVIEGRKGEAGRERLERFFRLTAAEIVPVTLDQVEIACAAFRRYGRGRHPAGLNFGDVFAYALAEATGEPLLFKGDDFAQTDIASAGADFTP